MSIRNYAEEYFASQGGYTQLPRSKFRFWIMFDFSDDARSMVFQEVSSVVLPSFSFDTMQLNQYNRKRNVQTRINYDPVTVTFYDTHDNKAMHLLQDYVRTFYNNGRGIGGRRSTEDVEARIFTPSVINDDFKTSKGFKPRHDDAVRGFPASPAHQRYYFSSIRIIQDGNQGINSYDTSYREIKCKNPMITGIQTDTLDYSDSNPVQITVTFQPEYVDINNIRGIRRDGESPGFDPGQYSNRTGTLEDF